MQLSADAIKRLISAIGFVPQNGKNGIYCKSYSLHNGYTVFVDFHMEKIVYNSGENPQGLAIKVWGKTTSNFSQAENFVILECVDRLLTKGYSPNCIELEKTYPSGHGHSGRLDILVKTADEVPFLIIECKTWDMEYEKEKSKMAKNGGQLFAYYSNDRDVRYLCLYTSRVEKVREYNNVIIDVEDAWRSLSGVKEIYDHWNKNFKDNGIFESFATPYDVKHRALTYGILKTLKEEDGGKIYNQIMEILRHNAVSDKPNAFNKLLNLFVCKIIDEDKNPDDELEFQWLETDTNESLQLRLNDLYKEGMWRFLEIDVIDYKQDDVAQRLASLDSDTKQWVMEMYTNTRLKKSPNFAFVEVQDERTFEHNAKIVREIVELLQVYKFRYAQKHEFLGNFFELLLNTSMKQEAGQYFTPVPITRFILSSLPLRELVQNRVDTRVGEPIPTVIDYACGSGHFLTEYMSQMQAIIDSNVIDIRNASPHIKKQFQAWQGLIKFLWARDTVYGIDLDNRLVKTTKVSAFFNGDGEANVVWANGLDHFTKSETYRGKLKRANGQDNGQFDILISNPPYSVESFKDTVAFGAESFELYSYLTDNSSEIECLFVERMKQLVKVGGWAAVVLPSSILANSGIHARAREILLKYFSIKAIVELGSGTFMKTGTNTVILFLERRNDNDYKAILREIEHFFTSKDNVTVAGIEHAFSTYVACVYDNLSLDDYLSIFSDIPTHTAREHELYADYKKAFGENFFNMAISIEKEKLLYFLLTHNQDVVLVKTGKGKDEKRFLGYEFSERRGHEGLHPLPSGTKLYDEGNPLNPQKASSYIYRSFLGEKVEIDESVVKNITYRSLSELIEFGTSSFFKVLNLARAPRKAPGKYPLVPIGAVCDVVIGGTPSRDVQEYFEGNHLWVSVAELNGNIIHATKEMISDEAIRNSNVKRIPAGKTLLSFKLSLGKVAMSGRPLYTNEAIAALIPKHPDEVLDKYLFYLFKGGLIDLNAVKGDNIFGKSLNSAQLKTKVLIPLPPREIQEKIVTEMERTDAEEQIVNGRMEEVYSDISAIIGRSYHESADLVKLRRIATYAQERVDAQNLDEDTYVGVDNLVPDVGGKRPSNFVPTSGTVIAYHPGNILLSNIRPYLKKAWLADNHGGSSGDVLVLVVDTEMAIPEYVFSHVSTDQFFEYEMQNIGSNVKMPRADKKKVLDFQIPLLPIQEQQQIVDEVAQKKAEIVRLNARLNELKEEKDAILKKNL